MSEEQIGGLRVPDHLPEDMIGAAIAYADAGWYVLPIDQATKHAGSVLGKGWPHKSSRDAEQIVDWFAGTDHGLALHVGRSGAVAFDVDTPTALTLELAVPCAAACYQSTRDNEPARGHYLFAVPPGAMFGNSNGDLGRAWGDVRGANGIIVVAPTAHEKAAAGGRYAWQRTGELPVLPESLAVKLRAPMTAEDATVSDAEILRWAEAHPSGTRAGGLTPILNKYREEAATGSRHNALVACLVWACKEVQAGLLAANKVIEEFSKLYTASMADATHPNGAKPNRKDFMGMLAWAIGQALVDPYVDHTAPPVGRSIPRNNVTPIRPHGVPNGGPSPEFDGNTARETNPEPEEIGDYPRYTDAGNATALIEQYGERLRFDCDRGRWLLFSGHRWRLQPPKGGEVRELAKDVAHQLPAATKVEASWQQRSLSTAGVTAALASAETIPGVSINTNMFDNDPYLLGTPGGVVDLRTGVLRPGRPQDMVSRSTTVTPESGPMPEVWTDFLNTTFSSDSELIGYVQRLFGLALIGEPLEQILPFFYGPLSANGKSTLLKTMQTILGLTDDGYATSIAAETLMVRRNEGHPTELAVLAGRRLIVASELEDGQQLAEARVKMITGDDVIQARFLFGQPFTFTATHLLIMVGNEKPTVTTGGDAMWRRLKSVPFNHQVPVADRIASSVLRQRFLDVGGHILTWMINGALDYQHKGGIRTCKAVDEATQIYKNEEDSIARFMDERTMLVEGGITVVKTLRGAYEGWCAGVGDVPVSAKRLTQQLAARFDVKSVLGGGGLRTYEGVLLLGSKDDEKGADGADKPEKSDSQPSWG